MRRAGIVGVLCGVMLGTAAILPGEWARAADLSSASQGADFGEERERIKQLLRQGSYREALQEVELLLQQAPEDSWARAYRALCERRLRSGDTFAHVSPDRAAALEQALEEERRAQAKAAAEAKALERRLAQEQATWDADIKRIQQEMVRAERAKQRAGPPVVAKAPEPRPPVVTPPPAPPVTVVPAPVPVPAVEPEAPEAEEPEVPLPPALPDAGAPAAARGPSVELAPIIVPTGVTPPAPEAPLRPPVPPGAIQIFADQMSVIKERQLATAEGSVLVVFDDGELTCDRVTVFTDTNDMYAQGRVRLERGKDIFRGELAHYNTKTKKGRFMEGTAYQHPWYQHGRMTYHLADGVMRVTPGYLTSCEFEPPHFRFQGRESTVFAGDQVAKASGTALFVEQLPLLYFPWLAVADRKSPFFLIPGKTKPWEQFALMGYRYELPADQEGVLRLDWRRAFGWGVGVDHKIDNAQLGSALLKVYYNEEQNRRRPREDLPKGADVNRYRVLWRHKWTPRPDTTVITDLQEFGDADFRRELLFREEFVEESQPESFISSITSTDDVTVSVLAKKRMNRFDTIDEALPQVTLDYKPQRLGDTQFFSETKFDVANLQHKTAHSEVDDGVSRVDWFEQLSYAMNWFRPILLTPKAGVRQTYYSREKQAIDDGKVERDFLSGQASLGGDASLKLFRIFPVTTNWLGLNINLLRHVITPTLTYTYNHAPTVPNELLNFAAAPGTTNQLAIGLENKLQTRRPDDRQKLRSVDLARFLVSLPYTFHGKGNEQGGRFGTWSFDAEFYPWNWMRLESDWAYESVVPIGATDTRYRTWNVDFVLVGGKGTPDAHDAPKISDPQGLTTGDTSAPVYRAFEPGLQETGVELPPPGQWYLGFGHRYSRNDKTEGVLEWNWQVSKKWQLGTFHRLTWKEVIGGSKRFTNVREYQYTLTRDLHDWIGQLAYRVDREFGEELFVLLTLKAYPDMPLEVSESYHQPKIGSQSSPFSPIKSP